MVGPIARKSLSRHRSTCEPTRGKTSQAVDISTVALQKMASKKFEGWKISCNNKTCGSVKFKPAEDQTWKKHATVDIKIRKQMQGLHIGRTALKMALAHSLENVFVANLRKSNVASKKMLEAVGFRVFDSSNSRQLCMFFIKV